MKSRAQERARLVLGAATLVAALSVAGLGHAQVPYLVADVRVNSDEETRTCEDWAGRAVFPGQTPGAGIEPWISDGTPSGTHILLDINPGTGDSLIPSGFGVTRSLFSVEWNEIAAPIRR